MIIEKLLNNGHLESILINKIINFKNTHKEDSEMIKLPQPFTPIHNNDELYKRPNTQIQIVKLDNSLDNSDKNFILKNTLVFPIKDNSINLYNLNKLKSKLKMKT